MNSSPPTSKKNLQRHCRHCRLEQIENSAPAATATHSSELSHTDHSGPQINLVVRIVLVTRIILVMRIILVTGLLANRSTKPATTMTPTIGVLIMHNNMCRNALSRIVCHVVTALCAKAPVLHKARHSRQPSTNAPLNFPNFSIISFFPFRQLTHEESHKSIYLHGRA